MSKEARLQAKQLKRQKGTTRIIVCEEVFDYRIGASLVGVVHPKSGTSFTIEKVDEHSMDFKRAIHAGFQHASAPPAPGPRPRGLWQKGLFDSNIDF